MHITVSVPGKVHLLGEHAVVYGKPAILSSIDRRLYVQVRTLSRNTFEGTNKLQSPFEIVIKSSAGDAVVKKAIEVFKKSFLLKMLPPLEVSITSQIPTGAGLGSSAAVSAGVIGALSKCVKNVWNPARINELAFEVEKATHGNPSGADNTAVVFGGLVWYRREFDFLKSIWSLPMSSYKIPQFLLIHTGKPKETTKEMVEHVARMSKNNSRVFWKILDDQEIQTKRLLLALRNGDRKDMLLAITEGERNLEKMGVVGNFAQKIIRTVEKSGGAAKVSGAGGREVGSGILLCYHEKLSVISKIGEKYKVNVLPVVLGGEGIRIEHAGSL